MRAVWTIVRREYITRVRSRLFLLGTLGVPILLAAIFGLQFWMATGSSRTRLVVVDDTGVLYAAIAERLADAGYDVRLVDAGVGASELDEQLTNDEIGAVLTLDRATLERGEVRLRAVSSPSAIRRLALRQAVVNAAVEQRLGDRSEADDVRALLRGGSLDITLVTREAEEAGALPEIVGFVGAFLLYIVILLYGVQLLRGVTEEKTSRVVEILVSTVEPWQLMLGKILGVGAVGLTQLGVWVGSIALLSVTGLPAVLASRPGFSDLGDLSGYLPGVGLLALYVVFFVLGYFLFAGLYAAVGAMATSDEETQQLQLPVTLLIVASVVVMPVVLSEPGSTRAIGLSLVPFFSPILMFPRIVAGAAAWWEVVAAIVLLVAAIVVVAWVAGRIYRVGILMQGKRPTLPEILRWLRAA